MNKVCLLALIIALAGCSPPANELPETNPAPYASQIQIEAMRGLLGATDDSRNPRGMDRGSLLMLMHFEGWVPDAYDDPAGYCTIGYGHLIALSRCGTIDLGRYATPLTKDQGADLLVNDTKLARIAVEDLVDVELSDQQFGALSSFVFNIGRGNFQASTLRSRLNSGRYEDAQREFSRWVHANGERLEGLVQRRACERAMFAGLIDIMPDAEFTRATCTTALGATEDVSSYVDIVVGEQTADGTR